MTNQENERETGEAIAAQQPTEQECRVCHRPFPYDPDADICPSCVNETA